MSRPPNYYDILGVRRDADTGEIRLAYLRMMKLHHPDSAPLSRSAGDFAAALNLCYATLKDPDKRARYDSQLLRRDAHDRAKPRYRRPSRLGRARLAGAAMLFAALAAILVGVATGPMLDRQAESLSALTAFWAPPKSVEAPLAAEAFADPAHARRLARLARTLPVSSAETFSRECFLSASGGSLQISADSCILFDVAFQYWRSTPEAEAGLPPHFSPQVARNRHQAAMDELGRDPDARLADIRLKALEALIGELEGEVFSADGVTPSRSLASPVP